MLQYLIVKNHLQSAKVYRQQSSLTWKQILLSSFTKGNREQFLSIFQLLRKEQKLQFYLRVYFLIYSIHPHINRQSKLGAISQKEINSFREFLDTKGADLAKTSQFLQFYALPFIKKPLQHATFKGLFSKNWVNNLKDKLTAYIEIEEQNMNLAIKALLSPLIKQSDKQKPTNIVSKGEAIQKQQKIYEQKQQKVYEQKFKKLEEKNKALFDELQTIKVTYKNLQQNHQAMIEDFNQYMLDSQNKWFQSYKQLVKTAKSLLQIVGSLTLQNPRLERKYLQSKKKVQKYQRFVAKKLQDLLCLSQDISVFDKPSMNQISQYTMKSGYTSKSWINNEKNIVLSQNNNISQTNNKSALNNNNTQLLSLNMEGLNANYTQSHNQNNITSYVEIDQYIGMDYDKLNKQFGRVSDQQKNLILEGLSWRLIKAKSMEIRRYYCISMITFNFIGLGKVDSQSSNQDLQLCTKFFTNPNIVQSVFQLVNYMKTDYYSRQWLFSSHNITYGIIQVMAESLQLKNVQLFLIGMDILSTISAYKDYRECILQSEFPIFLLDVLESYPVLFGSEQLMELIMMVLMNVSAYQQGLNLLQEYQNVFTILSTAYEHAYHDIIMLVNGFYYTLLSNRRLYQLAIESNLPQFVSYLLQCQQYSSHQRQLKFIQSRLQKYCNQTQLPQNIKNQQEDLFLMDGQNQYDQIELFEDQLLNLQLYIKGHQLLSNKYPLTPNSTHEQQNILHTINTHFISQQQLKLNLPQIKPSQSINKIPLKQTNKLPLKNIPQQNQLKKPNHKNHQLHQNKQKQKHKQHQPQQKEKQVQQKEKQVQKKEKQVKQKNQQAQVSIINLATPHIKNNQYSSQTIKQQIFKSPPPKIDLFVSPEQPIPPNTKQAQFMGLLSKQKNPTFAKQKTQPNQKIPSPTVPIYDNINLPNFGSYSPPPQLGPQQKTRRKQLLKQLNEEIQSKNKQKVQKPKTKLQYDKLNEQDKNGQFNQKKAKVEKEYQSAPKESRGNVHMKKQEFRKQKGVKQKQDQRKAFESKPKIHRTPPKDNQ